MGSSVRAWQDAYPEATLPDLISRTRNVGIAFSGGGARAMVAAAGQLAALHELGLLREVRYITGISGGSWATAAYSFAQLGQNGTASDDDELLGSITAPEDICNVSLSRVNPRSLRHLAMDFGPYGPYAPGPPGWEQRRGQRRRQLSREGDLVTNHIWHWLLKPVGVPRHVSFTWSNATLADIRRRNPHLANKTFVLPTSPTRPFPILGIALIGPKRLVPFEQSAKASQMLLLEATPLYIGAAHATRNQTYAPRDRRTAGPRTVQVGGLLEPFGFGGLAPPPAALPAGVTSGLLALPSLPPQPFALENATFASSNFPAEALATLEIPIRSWVATPLATGYWSPAAAAAPPAAEPFLLGDGGNVENIHLIGLLKRRVASIVLFMNCEGPLHSAAAWDPAAAPPATAAINDYVPAFFGLPIEASDEVEQLEQDYGIDYTADQVFATADFVPLAQRLQAAQMAGGGVVVTTTHVTVANARWGLPAGIVANVTWVYLSRAGAWEEQLRPEVARLVVPPPSRSPTPLDYGETVGTGEYRDFPNYPTDSLDFSPGQANMLADLTGWTVKHNAAQFARVIGSAPS